MPRGKKATGTCSVSKVMEKEGKVAGYELSNGQYVDVQEAVQMANNGEISGVIVAKTRYGGECLRTMPDGKEGNNITELPHETM